MKPRKPVAKKRKTRCKHTWQTIRSYKTGRQCHCAPGRQRESCPDCEGTGWQIDFAAIRAATANHRNHQNTMSNQDQTTPAAATALTPRPEPAPFKVIMSRYSVHTASIRFDAPRSSNPKVSAPPVRNVYVGNWLPGIEDARRIEVTIRILE